MKDESAQLTSDAQILLERQDYIGFFKACGPNFIRGIRRAQEVSANLTFESSSDESATQYKNAVATTRWSTPTWYQGAKGKDSSESMKTESNSLSIDIVGFGLGLSYEGSETFVARSIEEYLNVMKFAFRSMTSFKGSYDVGMVYGFEVTPWVESIAFQVAASVADDTIENPLPLSLIPRAFLLTDSSDFTFDNANRGLSTCQDPSYQIDMYGYCCEESALYDRSSGTYIPTEPNLRVCRPLRQLEPFELKDNLALNGEFVARLDQAVRFRLNQLSGLENCVSAIRAIPERYDFFILKPQETVKYDKAMDIKMSVFEMKVALDPENDYAMVTHMAKEFDEYMDMFIQPCYAALFGSTIGNTPDTDTSFLMAYPWYTHDECSKLSCFGNSMRWDREEKGCVPSLITGTSAPAYETTDGDSCVKELNPTGTGFQCKYSALSLTTMKTNMDKYWKKVVPQGRIDYFMTHFCLPQLSGEELSAEDASNLQKNYDHAKLGSESSVSVNVALKKPAFQKCTHPHLPRSTSAAGLAVDGNADRNYHNGHATHTCWGKSIYWEVDLQNDYKITHIEVIKVWWDVVKLDNSKIELKNAQGQVSATWTISTNVASADNIPAEGKMTFRYVAPLGGTQDSQVDIRKVRIISDPGRTAPFDLAEVRVYANVPVYNA